MQTQYLLGDGSTPIQSYQRYFRNGTWSGWAQLALNSNTYLLHGGTPIPENANIDTYTTPGKYGVSSSATARTMTGLPFEQGSTSIYAFNLLVEASAFTDPNERRQTLRFYNSDVTWSRRGNANGTWSTSWSSDISRAQNLPFHQITKNVTSTSVPLTFTPTYNGRYVALLFSEANDTAGRSGVWVIMYKPSVYNGVVKLAGPTSGDAVPACDYNTGVITITPGTWSVVKILSTEQFT